MAALRGAATGRRRLAPLLILLALVLLGHWLRVHNLDAFSFWTDEGLTPERSGYPIAQILRNDILIQGIVTKDTHPPLYYLILHLTRQLFGLSDFAFRYPSVLFGVLLIPLLYQFGRRLAPYPFWRGLGRSTGKRGSRGAGGRADAHARVVSTRGRGLTFGLIVALLAAVNPLQVYYSQEARMYSLLALLATGMSYVLWGAITTAAGRRPPAAGKGSRFQGPGAREARSSPGTWNLEPGTFFRGRRRSVVRSLLLYSALAALALYTHYTAAFLIAAQAVFWAWLLWRVGLRWVILAAVGLGLAAAVPLAPYTLPRLFSGAEANYYAVSPLTVLQDVARFFQLGLTVDYGRPLIVFFTLLGLTLALLGLWAARTWPRRLLLLSWLLAAPLGLILGSALFKPMYQGVRHIMAGSPAYLLLLAYGIWALWTWLPVPIAQSGKSRRTPPPRGGWALDSDPAAVLPWNLEPGAWNRPARAAFNPFGAVALILLFLGAVLSLVALYTDPAYVKDDFRAIVRFIETRAGGNDAIVYNNAVLLPLHEHYRLRPDLAVTAVPAYPQYATGQEPQLAALAAQYDRLWFVTDPPADGRDDAGLIRAWLDAHLLEVSDRLFPARTTEARVVGYATPAKGGGGAGEQGSGEAGTSPETWNLEPGTAGRGQPSAVGGLWDGLPSLTAAALDRTPLALPTLWVDLWWAGERPDSETQIVFSLTGPDGAEHYRRAHPLVRDAGFPWDPAAPNRLSYDLPLPPGLPPGTYTLAAGPDGAEPAALGQVEIRPTTEWPAAPEALFPADLAAVRGRPPAVFPNTLALAAIQPWDDHVQPGNNLPLTLMWRVGPDGVDLSNLRYRLEVIGAGGEALRAQEARPGAAWLERVSGGALLREVTSLYFRPETPSGRYRLRWTLLDGDAPLGKPVTAGEVTVALDPPQTQPPATTTRVGDGSGARFGDEVRLYGFDLGSVRDGALPLTLTWQAAGTPDTSWAVFVHLVDRAGQIVAQADALPAGGLRPTTGWRRGEFVADSYTLDLPRDLPAGDYRLNVGLYNPDDGSRPPVALDGAQQPDNQLTLTTVSLPEVAP